MPAFPNVHLIIAIILQGRNYSHFVNERLKKDLPVIDIYSGITNPKHNDLKQQTCHLTVSVGQELGSSLDE